MKTIDELREKRENLIEEIEDLQDDIDLIQTKIECNQKIVELLDNEIEETKVLLPYLSRIRRCKF